MRMPTAMMSGHLDLTPQEFEEHYKPLIDQAIAEGCDFIVADARGTDAMTQEYLASHAGAFKVTVYHMFDSPRNNRGNFPTQGGYPSDDERDTAMTAASDFDIAWVRPGREKSGTARNIARRNKHQ
jgi:hypothetical protein